jgi:AcrR family transcriptional regulator
MPRKQKQDKTIKEYLVIDDPAAIKLLFVPKFADILKLIGPAEMSVSDIAHALGINPGSAYYRLKTLEKHGLAKLVRDEIRGGVVVKYYRKAAVNITIDTGNIEDRAIASETGLDESYKERLLHCMSYFGYDVPEGSMGEAKNQLTVCDGRMKAVLREIQQAGLEKHESDRNLIANAYQLALVLRLADDEELYTSLKRLVGTFNKTK